MRIEDLKEIDYLKLSDKKIELLNAYMTIALEENKKFNLTRNDTEDEFIVKNILDSLLILKDVDLSKKSVIDIGSGAGLPGIPLAICFPNANVTLLEPTLKRANFLAMVSDKLDLKNVKVVAKRAEDYINEGHRETYDIVVSRAVSKLSILLELSIPFLKVNGTLIAYKGLNYEEEIIEATSALKTLGSTLVETKIYHLDYINESRYDLFIKKNKKTGKNYPRLYKDIKKRPL